MARPKNTRPATQGGAPKGRKAVRFQKRTPTVHSDDEDDNQDGGVQLNAETTIDPKHQVPAGEEAAVDADAQESDDDGGVPVVNIKPQSAPIVVSGTVTPRTGTPVGFKLDPTTTVFEPHKQGSVSQTKQEEIKKAGRQPAQAYKTGRIAGVQAASQPPVSNSYTNNTNGQTYIRQNGQQTRAMSGPVNGQNGQKTHGMNGPVNGRNDAVRTTTNGGQRPYIGHRNGSLLSEDSGSLESADSPSDTSDTSHNRSVQSGKEPVLKSEPHDFAPRLAQPIVDEAPPRFVLAGAAPPVDNQAVKVTGAGSAQLVPYNADPFSAGPPNVAQQQVVALHPSSLTMAPHIGGPVPDHIKGLRSAHLNRITDGPMGRPTLDVALDPANFPFIQSTSQAEPVSYGVVKIKNIPFATRRAEIIAFLGRNSKVLNDNQEPVHIIMERVTSKTHDAYVEFMSLHDAMKAVERHSRTLTRGKPPRLGDRPVDVELSSQAALMKDIFPLASGVFWDGSKPRIVAAAPREPWNSFKGFITEEEMTMLVKHVEIPQRSPFSRDCPQRPFECMISTLKKLPWYMADYITIRQRHAVYKATVDLIRLLQLAIGDRRNEQALTPQLLKRLFTAAMLCPGFTVTMKDDIGYLVNLNEAEQRGFNQPRFADCWRHAYTLAPKPGIPIDVLEWYIAIIREETTRYVNSLGLSDRGRIMARAQGTNGYFGYFWLELSLPAGPAFDNLTLAAAASIEFGTLERIFSRAFPQRC